jgi:site-specific recombinase XerD
MKILETADDFLLTKEIEEGRSPATVRAYRYDLVMFAAVVGDVEVDHITPLHVRKFLRELAERHYTKKGVGRKIAALRSFFSFLVFNDLIDKNPMDKIRSPQVHAEEDLPKFLPEAQIQRVMSEAPHLRGLGFRRRLRIALVIRLMYATLARVGEVCRLCVKDLDFHAGIVRLRGKGNKERLVPVDEETLVKVVEYMDRAHFTGDPEEYIFHNPSGQAITPRTIQLDLKQAKKLLGLPESTKFTPHVMRHTGATHLRQRGMDLSELQDLLGHASPKTTRIYAKNDITALKDQYTRLHPLASHAASENVGGP